MYIYPQNFHKQAIVKIRPLFPQGLFCAVSQGRLTGLHGSKSKSPNALIIGGG